MEKPSLKIRLSDTWNNAKIRFSNWRRKKQKRPADYILLNINGTLPEYIPPEPSWFWWLHFIGVPTPPTPISLNYLRYVVESLTADPRPLGVLIHLNDLNFGWAKAQTIRDLIKKLRDNGKKVIVYSLDYTNLSYFIASAADTILMPPPARWAVNGLRSELTFLKDAIGAWGVEVEVVNVSPYKTAGDTFARADISPQHKEMLNWILDGVFETVTSAISEGRHLEAGRVRELIDLSPLTAEAARQSGLIDAILYEDEIAKYLVPPDAEHPESKFESLKKKLPWAKKDDEPQTPKANIKRFGAVRGELMRPIRWRTGKYIGVISLEGLITPGRSQRPPSLPIPIPFGDEEIAGAETIAQHFREVEKDDEIAAIVFYVDSRGGSALASDLIWREVERVRRKKPVVVCFGDAAASGGYYVSAGAQWIVAQPLTITGSIGVITMKFVTSGLYNRFKANRVVLQRGERAGLYADDAPFTSEQRDVVQKEIDAYYDQFKNVVRSGRKIEDGALDEIAGGRVWLGKQALTHKLVDAIGDLQTAIDKAIELAKMPSDKWTGTAWFSGRGGNLLPPPFPSSRADAAIEFFASLPSLMRERVWMIDPFKFKIE
jgi:protease-4